MCTVSPIVQDETTRQVLTDVQEHRHAGPPVTMTTLHTKHGFPIVRELDFTSARTTVGSRGTGGSGVLPGSNRLKKKTKSLFSKQFENKELDFFGIDINPVTDAVRDLRSRKDFVEPICLATEIRNQGSGMECGQASGNDGVLESVGVKKVEEEAKMEEGHESSPAVLCDWCVCM